MRFDKKSCIGLIAMVNWLMIDWCCSWWRNLTNSYPQFQLYTQAMTHFAKYYIENILWWDVELAWIGNSNKKITNKIQLHLGCHNNYDNSESLWWPIVTLWERLQIFLNYNIIKKEPKPPLIIFSFVPVIIWWIAC